MGGLGSLLGCLIAAAGCASDQEARRNETTTVRERGHDREVRRDRDRDGNGVRDDREVRGDHDGDGVRDTREADIARNSDALDDKVAVKPVPIANGENVRDNVGDREHVSDNLADKDRVRDADRTGTDTDRALTSRIRESIVADDELSTKAKNVEIISKNGAVTLRGPVATAAEKSRVASHAQNQAGAKRVNNEIEVTR
jgi:osmotically-inducible protein OsmY